MDTFDDDEFAAAAADEIDAAAAEVADRLAGGELQIRRQAIELIVQTERYLWEHAEKNPGEA